MGSSPTPGFMIEPRPATLEEVSGEPVRVGAGTAVLLRGTIDAATAGRARVELRVGGRSHRVGVAAAPSAGPGRVLWWALVPVPAGCVGPLPLEIGVRGNSDSLGRLELASPEPRGTSLAFPDGDSPLIAVCMATYEPDPRRLARQVDSIRAQSWPRWICLISDDASSAPGSAAIEDAIGGDGRFIVSRSPERLGFYANFERALGMVPAEASLVALSDQDDRWHPDKLAALTAELDDRPRALLAYSDMRILDDEGEVISDTFWYQSTNAYEDLATLAIVNTVTGGASLFRRELLDLALPFPPSFSDQHYHDHWLALCALATGELAYLDRPTYDYTRHAESVTVGASRQWSAPARSTSGRLVQRLKVIGRRIRLALERGAWSAAYLDRFLMLRQYASVLEARAGGRIPAARRRRLELVTRADRSPRAFGWLLVRTLRPLLGHDETLGRERVLAGGIVWWCSASAWVRLARR